MNSGENQALWVDVRVPGDAAAGIYKGTFTLTVNQTKKAIPVTLKVYDVTLPEEVHNPTAFDIWYQNIAYGEGNNMDEGTLREIFRVSLDETLKLRNPAPRLYEIDGFLARLHRSSRSQSQSDGVQNSHSAVCQYRAGQNSARRQGQIYGSGNQCGKGSDQKRA